jgi:hypothetical protein
MKMAAAVRNNGLETLPEPLLTGRFSFLDECRWSSLPCPAADLLRINIHRSGGITPCITGGCIGEVGDDIAVIKRRLHRYATEEKKKRGCRSCPAEKHCSRCLFPAPVTTEEFCRLQKSASGLTAATNLFSSLRTAYLYRTMPKKIFFSLYPELPLETFQGIKRLATVLQLRRTDG